MGLPVPLFVIQSAFSEALCDLWLAFQPIVYSGSKKILGYEALMRSKSQKLPHPGAIIEAAERLNCLHKLGQKIRKICAENIIQCPDINANIFINLHPQDLLDDKLYDPHEPLSKYANRIILEITERASLESINNIDEKINLLKMMGYKVAVDDLGSGYSGLSSIAILRPEILKIDMTLIRGIHTNVIQQNIVRSLISLSVSMNMEIIAEGVETHDERCFLMNNGCDLLQGYLLARPGPNFPSVNWW